MSISIFSSQIPGEKDIPLLDDAQLIGEQLAEDENIYKLLAGIIDDKGDTSKGTKQDVSKDRGWEVEGDVSTDHAGGGLIDQEMAAGQKAEKQTQQQQQQQQQTQQQPTDEAPTDQTTLGLLDEKSVDRNLHLYFSPSLFIKKPQ